MHLQKLKDNELIHLYLSGNSLGLEILVRRHQKKVFGYLMNLVKDYDLANDLFQETFIKVINTFQSGTYKDQGKFINWVVRIAHNIAIDYFRKQKISPQIENKEEFDFLKYVAIVEPNIEDCMITEQIHVELRKSILFLSKEQQEVLILRHYNNMSFKEIAEHLNVNINTALGRMRYALINLRKIIEEKNIVLTH
ncbi:MAG: sigma-70 family RNA polymerase sigma factor [Bacteroidota bacterium]